MAEKEKTRQLSLGFIGGGLSSAIGHTHFAASRMDGRWRLDAGVFSRNEKTNAETGASWQVASDRVYASWRDLILAERSRLDAVAVLTPTPSHYEIVQALLKAGIPIICETALAGTLNEARTLLAQYNPTKNFVAITYNYSAYPMLRELRQRIRDGQFGRIHQLHIEMPQDTLVRPAGAATDAAHAHEQHPRDDFIPTLCLEFGVHLHHLAHFLTDEEPETVNAEFSTYSPHKDIVDNATMWLQYASGISASFWMSKTAIGRRNGLRVRLFGSKGSAEWYHADPEHLYIATADGMQMAIDRGPQAIVASGGRYNRVGVGHPAGFIEAYANLYADCADALIAWRSDHRQVNPYVYGVQHAVNGLSLLHAARLSSSRRRWERIHAPVTYRETLTHRLQR